MKATLQEERVRSSGALRRRDNPDDSEVNPLGRDFLIPTSALSVAKSQIANLLLTSQKNVADSEICDNAPFIVGPDLRIRTSTSPDYVADSEICDNGGRRSATTGEGGDNGGRRSATNVPYPLWSGSPNPDQRNNNLLTIIIDSLTLIS